MRKFAFIAFLAAAFTGCATAQQTTPSGSNLPVKTAAPANAVSSTRPASSPVDRGTVAGRTYTNKSFGFDITFPDTWLVADDNYLAYMKSHGVDLTPKPPKAATPLGQGQLDAAFKRVDVLISAYRSLPGSAENSVVRVAVEDVRHVNTNRPIKDAVDYIDLLRSTFLLAKMPDDFDYSETQAEKLGSHQFAYLDTAGKEGKSRIYATVRNGYAILFILNYTADADLDTFRDMLARAHFTAK
jgi:hypothetical protein